MIVFLPLSIVDVSAIMIYEPPEPCEECGPQLSSSFPFFSAELERLRKLLHLLGHEITWLSIIGIYAVTPSTIWIGRRSQ